MPKEKHKQLTENERRFCDNVLKKKVKLRWNNSKCYMDAFPGQVSENSAAAAATRCLKKPHIKQYLKDRRVRAQRYTEASIKRIVEEELRIAYSDLGEIFDGFTLVPITDLPENVRRALKSVTVKEKVLKAGDKEKVVQREWKYSLWNKGQALERMGRHLGMFEKDNSQRATNILIKSAIPEPNKPPKEDA